MVKLVQILRPAKLSKALEELSNVNEEEISKIWNRISAASGGEFIAIILGGTATPDDFSKAFNHLAVGQVAKALERIKFLDLEAFIAKAFGGTVNPQDFSTALNRLTLEQFAKALELISMDDVRVISPEDEKMFKKFPDLPAE